MVIDLNMKVSKQHQRNKALGLDHLEMFKESSILGNSVNIAT